MIPPNPKNPEAAKFFIGLAVLELFVIGAVLFVSNMLFGSPFEFEKAIFLWAFALAPFPIAILLYTKNLKS